MHYRDLGFTDLPGVDAGHSYPFVVDIKHYFGGVRGRLLKYRFQDGDDELHGGVVVIVEENLVEAGLPGFTLILGGNQSFSLMLVFSHGRASINDR
jgi:hypothetical protein